MHGRAGIFARSALAALLAIALTACGSASTDGIAANADAAFFDGGLCGSQRGDLAARADLCGAFKVPSLRNGALRNHFFHNGVFTSLEQVIRFYVRRDTDPRLWYSLDAQDSPVPYDDLAASRRSNVNASEGPYSRTPSQRATLTDAEIADLANFLRTLTDGYQP